MIRKVISVIVGLFMAVVIFMLAESMVGKLNPPPEGLDYGDGGAVKEYFSSRPLTYWLPVLFGWSLGSFMCGLVIKLISKSDKKILPMIGGVVLTLSAVANFMVLPHPTWFVIVGLILFLPFTCWGHSIYKVKK